jgi:tetratricopeptide (TPR) repeat protein
VVWFYEQDLAIAREIGDRAGEGAVLGNLGVAYRKLGEPRRAIDYHGRRLAIARNLGDRRGEGIALFNMSLAFNDLGERDRMLASTEAALLVFQSLEDPHADKVRTQLLRWREDWREDM